MTHLRIVKDGRERAPRKSLVVNALTGMVWTVLPDGHVDFLTNANANTEFSGTEPCGCGGGMNNMIVRRSLVSVVDDDESVRESLPDLLTEFGFEAHAFSSPEEFLASDYVGQTKCLILDIAMPGMSGPDLQRELRLRGQEIPIIFITASTDKTVRPQLLEQGAIECLFKPFSDTALLEALNAAFRPK
jgi:CheY-like chemotaxis protein